MGERYKGMAMSKALNCILLMSAIAASGCVDPEVENARIEAKLEATCLARGLEKNTQPYYMCMIKENDAELAASQQRQNVGAALAGGLQAYGRSQQQTFGNRSTTHCRSYQLGYSIQTDCNSY